MTVRYDIYRNIHMGLRALMAETLLAVGRMDAADVAELDTVLGQVRFLINFCRMHLKKEEKFVHPAMEARAPGSAASANADHAHHLADFAALESAVAAAETGGTAAALALYRALALFVGENFVHMEMEETAHNQILWRTHSDAEIIALEHAIVGSLSAEEKPASLRWMLPALPPALRSEMLKMLRPGMPPQAFDGLLAMLKPHLGASGWQKLSDALAPVPAAA